MWPTAPPKKSFSSKEDFATVSNICALKVISPSVQVSGYCGLLVGSPVIVYEIIAFILPGLTKEERRFLGPIVLGSSILFYAGITFSYYVLTPAALTFFVSYAEGVVESLWSIDQYFEFVLVLMFSTGLSFQVTLYSWRFEVFLCCFFIFFVLLVTVLFLVETPRFLIARENLLWC